MKLSAVIRELIAAGLHGEALAAAVERVEATMEPPVDQAAEKRRAWDRERKRAKRAASTGNPPDPVESAENADASRTRVVSTSLPSEEVKNPHPPSEDTPKGVRAHRMPDDFSLDDELIAYGVAQGLSHAETRACEPDIREWGANNGHRAIGRKLDWRAFAKTWLRRVAKDRRRQPPVRAGPPAKRDMWAEIRRATRDLDNGQGPHQQNGHNGRRADRFDARPFADGREDPQRGQVLDLEPLRDRSGTGSNG